MREIDGEAGQNVVDSLADISPELGHQVVSWTFGESYARPGPPPRDRQLVTLGMLTALGGCEPQLEVHLNAALNVGLTPAEWWCGVLGHFAAARGQRLSHASMRPRRSGMTESMLVTGGTGTLGRVVAEKLLAKGIEVRVLSRRPAPAGTPYAWRVGDLRTGAGVDEAVAGTDAIVHCATTFRRGGDVAATRTLIGAARRAGSPRLVYISIVGVDRVPLFYYRGKLAAEHLVEESGLPWTILRTTQFHDLIAAMAAAQKRLPVVLTLSGIRFQPIDVREVADRLVDLALGPERGRVPDLGGPEIRTAGDLTRAYLRAAGSHRPVMPVWLPGRAASAYREGGHLAPGNAVGETTFDEFLNVSRAPR